MYTHGEAAPHEVAGALTRFKADGLVLIKQATEDLKEEIEELDHVDNKNIVQHSELSRKAFIVHGHDEAPREAVARFLSNLGVQPIILHEQPNKGRTLIEKFEQHGDVSFAVVLLTPDDVGGSSQNELKPRARQNVILELGYFIGKLTRARVCALKKGNVEQPSDIVGVAYVDYDDSGKWRQELAREIEAAGIEIDWNKVMRT